MDFYFEIEVDFKPVHDFVDTIDRLTVWNAFYHNTEIAQSVDFSLCVAIEKIYDSARSSV